MVNSKINVILFTFSFITLCVYSCNWKGYSSHNIEGFWKFEISNPSKNGDHIGVFFGEITDTTFTFWHKNAEYLPPLRYWIREDSIFVKSLSRMSLESSEKKTPEYFGTIYEWKINHFKIFNKSETYDFKRSSKESFFLESKVIWLEMR